jgi:hypothetical protein
MYWRSFSTLFTPGYVHHVHGGHQSNQRKPPTCLKLVTNFITSSFIEKYTTPQLQKKKCDSEWASGCCLSTNEDFFLSVISWLEHVIFRWDDNGVRFMLDQHGELDFYSASSLKQQTVGIHVAPLGRIIKISRQPIFTLTP